MESKKKVYLALLLKAIKKNSDIDFLVEFEKPDFDNFMDLVFYLEKLFGR